MSEPGEAARVAAQQIAPPQMEWFGKTAAQIIQDAIDDVVVEKDAEIETLKQISKAAHSREREANRDWSTEAKKWLIERNQLRAEIKLLKEEKEQLRLDYSKMKSVALRIRKRKL